MNLPNKITVSRIFGTLLFVILASYPETWSNHLLVWRIGYVVGFLSAVSDWFDGYYARKLNMVTDFGKLMDPLADKVFTIACFVIFSAKGYIPAWITVAIAAREFTVTGLRTLAASKGEVIEAKNIGKVKTTLQMLVLALGGCFWVEWLPTEGPIYQYIWPGVLYSIAALTIYSGWEYMWNGRQLYMQDT
ncbi:MAG: CDP-diacylglycerol--glycerol-3-phosphate 3-phosphatidyltransferase [Lentisphaeria bacterium]|nr:CDP-diacylglycerol--glycerol-3-phosphate 3-phosphatidyltransferase [Lentisphaeria bacterium]